MNSLELFKSTSEAMVGVIITLVVVIVYMFSYCLCKKVEKEKLVQKVANIIASLFVWEEAIFGTLYSAVGLNSLKYILIIAAVLVLLNSILDE